MELCNNCYIVHEERQCPLCDAKQEIQSLENRVEELETELKEVERI